jgi:hypothetical protein
LFLLRIALANLLVFITIFFDISTIDEDINEAFKVFAVKLPDDYITFVGVRFRKI